MFFSHAVGVQAPPVLPSTPGKADPLGNPPKVAGGERAATNTRNRPRPDAMPGGVGPLLFFTSPLMREQAKKPGINLRPAGI